MLRSPVLVFTVALLLAILGVTEAACQRGKGNGNGRGSNRGKGRGNYGGSTRMTTTTKPAATGSAATEPTASEPVATESTAAEPTATDPTATEPASGTGSSSWLKPTPGTSFLWSLDQMIPSNPVGQNGLALGGMQIYDVDLVEATAEQISEFKAQGKKVVCYFSAGTFEDGRPDGGDFDEACYCNKGSSCAMDGWPEWWLDIHTPACVTNVQGVMQERINKAKEKGCDAVEPDNTDSYGNKSGWETTIDDQFNYLKFLSTTAHSAGLGIALKNGPEMISEKPEIVSLTDFVLIEECQRYNECDAYEPFVKAGKAAFQVEYGSDLTCSAILPGFFALSYSGDTVNYENVQGFCPEQ